MYNIRLLAKVGPQTETVRVVYYRRESTGVWRGWILFFNSNITHRFERTNLEEKVIRKMWHIKIPVFTFL